MTSPSFDTNTAGESKRRIRGMLIVLLATAITSAAVVAEIALHRVVEKSSGSEVLLLQLQGSAHRLSALEWHAISEQKMSAKIIASVQGARDEMKRAIERLERLDANAGNLRSVRQTYDAYHLALNEEFSLIKAGDFSQAHRIDEEMVDPAFDALTQALSSTGAAFRTKAEQMAQLDFIGSILILLLTIVTIGFLVWRNQVAQAATEAAAVEQRALIQGHAELRQFADNIPSMSASFDDRLRCIFANKRYADFFGFGQAEIIGKHLREILGEKVYSEVERHFAQVLQGRPVTYQRTFKLQDGKSRYLEVRLVPDIGHQGKVLGFFAVAHDITERKETEDRIAHLNRVYAVLGGINALIVRVHDRDELFRESCRIAVEAGGFRMSLIAIADRSAMKIVPVASAGADEELLTAIKGMLSSSESAPNTMIARAMRDKKAVVSNASQGDPQALLGEKHAEAGVRSLAVLPLMIADEAAGILALYASESEFFHEKEMKLLLELAGNIAFAIEHIGKEEKIVRFGRVQAVTGGINALIVRVHGRQELFDGACRIAVEQGNFAMAWIGALDPATQDVTPVAWAGENAEALTRVKSSARDGTPRGRGAVGMSVRERRPVFNNDIVGHGFGGPRHDEIQRLGFQSQITLPLYEDQAVVGTLTMYAKEPGFFDEEEVRLLTDLAGNISFALANIGRQERLDKLARIRAISSEINAAIIRIRDREALLRETCRIAVEHGKFELVWIAWLDREQQRIRPVAWAGFSSGIAHELTWAHLAMPGVTLAEVIRTRKVAVRNDIDAEAPVGTLRREAMKRGCHSTVCVPFMVDDSVAAAMILFAAGRGFFDDEELRLLNEVATDVSFALQAISQQEKLNYLAYYDSLTGLANRSLFLERVAQHMRAAASGGHKLALFLIDLERFKNINDSLGRPAGDELLKQVAEWLTRNAGDASLLARVGADHFAAVLPEIQQEGAVARVLEKSIDAFLDHPFRLNDALFRIALKVGVALFPDDGADADTLFRNAEAALKKAKSSGERYLFHTQKMTEAVAGKLALENQLREALDKGEFVLHYQPKIDLASGAVCGLEALIRWQKPGSGLVAPGDFIPLLEETGLILGVGKWALSKALAQHRGWTARGIAAPRIAVNVSAIQLQQKDFADVVIGALQEQGDNPDALEIEVTESLLMQDVPESIRKLSLLRGLGIHIAMDDFGTGHSSLSYLARLPLNSLKIDRSFITEMANNPQDMAIITTIIALAHSLNLRVVAEGVETESQSKLLRLLKCDEAQGFLFSKPLSAAEIEPLLRTPAGEARKAERA